MMSIGRGLVQVVMVSMVTMLIDALMTMMLFLVLLVEMTAIVLMLAKFAILGNAGIQQVPCCHGNTCVRMAFLGIT